MELSTYSPSKFLNKPSKRNRYYFNYNSDNQSDEKRKSSDDRTKINNLANRLRTLLKLPKAHKWAIYEWFYSNLDQPLFCYNRPNDFQLCLNDILPQLKTRQLRRTEWCQIRKLMGKPRRCSAAFLEEERETLKRKREKIREIYLNSSIDNLTDYQDLPETISLPLIIGSRCTVLYKKTHEGLFDGTINAIDLKNGMYRVNFDKEDFGCENVHDFDIRSIEQVESMPLVAFESKKNRITSSTISSNVKKLYNHQKLNEMIDEQMRVNQYHQLNSVKEKKDLGVEMNSVMSVNSDDSFIRFMNHCSLNSNNSTNSTNSLNYQDTSTYHPTLSNSTINSIVHPFDSPTNSNLSTCISQTVQANDEKIIGNYPFKFLACIISFYKLINKKSAKLNELKSMNTQAEFYKSSTKNAQLSNEFRNEYATIILDLEKIKDNLNLNLEHLEQHCKELKLCIKQINKNGNFPEKEFVKRNLTDKQIDQHSNELITNLVGLLLMLKTSESEEHLSSIQIKIKSIKQTLDSRNISCFENNIEMHFNHLQFNYSLDKMTNSRLDAFHNDHV